MKMLRSLTLIAASVFIFAFAAFAFAGNASAAGNVTGFAWSDSAGWISMSCDNSALTDGNAIPNSCSTVDYGVTLDPATGAMSGYAWSTNMGWMKFDPSGTTPTYTANRLGNARVLGVTTAGVRPTVGWARFCSSFNQSTMPDNCTGGNTITTSNGAWNGWVAMSGDGSDGNPAYGVTYDNVTGNFNGFAWGGTVEGQSGSEVIGYISFKGVYASKNPVAYVPIVKIAANPFLIQAGGDTNIDYYWVNADADPMHQMSSCTAFTDQGQVTNWNNGAISSANLPISTLRTKNNVFAFAPSTVYYLDCKDRAGNHAGDPANSPMVGCNTSTPTTTANTCPRTRIDVIEPSGELILSIKADAGTAPLGTTPVMVNLGETVSISWKSASPISNCKGYSDLGVFNWRLPSLGGTTKAPVSNTIESGVQVAPAATNYYMSCTIGGVTKWSNVVKATVKADPTGAPTLLGRVSGSSDAFTTSVQVDANETVELQWSSNNSTAWSNCLAVPNTTPEPTNWETNQIKPGIAAPTYRQNELGVLVPTSPTIYQIMCDTTGSTGIRSNTVTVVRNVPPDTANLNLGISLAGVGSYSSSVVVPQTENVDLQWTSTGGLMPGSCRNSSVGASYWPAGAVVNPTGNATGLNLDRADTVVTTYTVTCKRSSDGSDIWASATAISMAPNILTPVVTIEGTTCVKNAGIGFDLTWRVTGGSTSNGNVTLSNDGGQMDWDGTRTVTGPSSWGTPNREQGAAGWFYVTNPTQTIFRLLYTDGNGVSYPPATIHTVTIDPDCEQSPRRSWFFKFFEN